MFDRTGRYVRHFGRSGRGPGEFSSPGGLAVTADDTIGGGLRSVSSGGVVESPKLSKADIEKRLSELQFADVVAPIRRITAGVAGRLWILRTGALVTEAGRIDIVGTDLRYLGTLPAQPLPDAFGPDGRAAWIVKDELDVARIVVRQFPAFQVAPVR